MKLMVKGFLLAAAVGLVACGYFLGGKSQAGPAAQRVAPLEDSGYRYALDRGGERSSGLVRAEYRGPGQVQGIRSYFTAPRSSVYHLQGGPDGHTTDLQSLNKNFAWFSHAGFRPCPVCFPYVGNQKSSLLHRTGSQHEKETDTVNLVPFLSRAEGLRNSYNRCKTCD